MKVRYNSTASGYVFLNLPYLDIENWYQIKQKWFLKEFSRPLKDDKFKSYSSSNHDIGYTAFVFH